jgi:hypothetical protein
MVARGTAAMHDRDVQDNAFQLVIDQLEELVVTVIEEIRDRPNVALAIAAGVVGALVGSMLAARTSGRTASPATRAARNARGIGDAADLARIGLRLMQNPIVRGLVLTAIERQLRRRIPF